MSSQPNTFVVGASQGIGLAVAQRLAARGDNVYASVRTVKPLEGIKGSNILKLDVLDQASIDAAAAQVSTLDTLYVNAAIGDHEELLTTTPERLTEYFASNVVGVHRVVLAFLPALRKGTKKEIVLTTSGLGSLAFTVGAPKDSKPEGGYSITKTALNSYANQLQIALLGEGFKVVPIHPGVVQTALGSRFLSFFQNGPIPIIQPAESAEGIVKTVEKAVKEHDGKIHFWTYAGTELPW
ncbi:hypothetical protein OC861_001668 [Tilletia horrida]|nr:hypothetical protein OC845_003567 [Tilletia horrida]KAK0568740.1 hypothetical protein OC861_001668 [Tilletia horrida]